MLEYRLAQLGSGRFKLGLIALLEHRVELEHQEIGFRRFVIEMLRLRLLTGELRERGVQQVLFRCVVYRQRRFELLEHPFAPLRFSGICKLLQKRFYNVMIVDQDLDGIVSAGGKFSTIRLHRVPLCKRSRYGIPEASNAKRAKKQAPKLSSSNHAVVSSSPIAVRHSSVLLCPPAHFTVRDVKNPFMDPAQAVDSARALEQWEALRAAFTTAGVASHIVDPVDDLEDMVFAANQAFVGNGSLHARFAVPSAMRYPSRRREVPYFARWLTDHGFDVLDLGLDVDAGDYLEGHGDLLAHPGDAHVWAGFGLRSSPSGLARFSAAMKAESIRVTPLELADEHFYHLDTCFAPLNSEAALIYAPAFTRDALAALRRGWRRLHEVDGKDALAFACNGIAVNGYFIVAHPSDAVVDAVRVEGLVPLVVDASEFEKAGGSVFCMKTFLD